MKFPLKGKTKVVINEGMGFSDDYSTLAEIPLGVHPGAFATIRKNHIHEGVDIYCNEGDEVIAVEDGILLSITPFTGAKVNSPWWEDTFSIMVKHKNFTINYGEVIPNGLLKVGQHICEGQTLGTVKRVLKKNKGRPMSMLHMEMYHNFYGEDEIVEPIKEWSLGLAKPAFLMNPSAYLLQFLTKDKCE